MFLTKSAMQSGALIFGKLSLEASVNFNQRRAGGSVTYCEATQRNWQWRTKGSTAKIQSEHRQINFFFSHILIHLQRWAHIYYTSKLVKMNKDNSSILCRIRNIFQLLVPIFCFLNPQRKPCDSGKDRKYLVNCCLEEKEKVHLPI